MQKTVSLTTLALILALPLTSQAYLSTESDQINTPASGVGGLVSGAIDGHNGNTDYQDYSIGGRVNYQAGVTGMSLAGEYDNARASNHRLAESTWLHGGYLDEFQRGLAAEAYLDFQKNDFRQLNNRTQFGIGPRFTLDYDADQRVVYGGVGLMREWRDQANVNQGFWRLNSYLAYKRQIAPQTRLLVNAGWQPRLDRGSDFLTSLETAVLVNVAGSADLKVGLRYSYDNHTPPGVKADDTVYGTSFQYRF